MRRRRRKRVPSLSFRATVTHVLISVPSLATEEEEGGERIMILKLIISVQFILLKPENKVGGPTKKERKGNGKGKGGVSFCPTETSRRAVMSARLLIQRHC